MIRIILQIESEVAPVWDETHLSFDSEDDGIALPFHKCAVIDNFHHLTLIPAVMS